MEWCIECFFVKIVSVAEIGVIKGSVKGNQSLLLCNHAPTHFLPILPTLQRRINVVSTLWINVNVDLTLKFSTSDFQRCTALIQRQCPTLKQHRNNDTQRRKTLHNVCTTLTERFNLASMLVKAMLNSIGLVMIRNLQINE